MAQAQLENNPSQAVDGKKSSLFHYDIFPLIFLWDPLVVKYIQSKLGDGPFSLDQTSQEEELRKCPYCSEMMPAKSLKYC